MRRACLVMLLASPALADEAPYDRRFTGPEPGIVSPEPGLPALRREGTYYILTIGEDATPSCAAWNVEPDPAGDPGEPTDGKLVSGADEVAYHSRGDELLVCGQDTTAKEDGKDLDVGGARWFHDEASCKRAIAKHRRVGMDFRACTGMDNAGTQARFEAVMLHSGTLFTPGDDNKCKRIQVVARPADQGQSTMVTEVDADTDEYASFSYDSGRLEVFDERTVHKKHTDDVIGTGYYSAGPSEYSFAFYADVVRDGITAYYLYRNTCEASFALATKRAAWLPPAR